MGKLTLHARIEIGLVAVLLLGSCDRPQWEDTLDVADVNARNAIARVEGLASRVSELERELEVQDRMIDALSADAETDRDLINGNADVYNHFKDTTNDRLGRIEARLGM